MVSEPWPFLFNLIFFFSLFPPFSHPLTKLNSPTTLHHCNRPHLSLNFLHFPLLFLFVISRRQCNLAYDPLRFSTRQPTRPNDSLCFSNRQPTWPNQTPDHQPKSAIRICNHHTLEPDSALWNWLRPNSIPTSSPSFRLQALMLLLF